MEEQPTRNFKFARCISLETDFYDMRNNRVQIKQGANLVITVCGTPLELNQTQADNLGTILKSYAAHGDCNELVEEQNG